MFNSTLFHVPVIVQTSVLLLLSNVFMTFAWYAHLKNLSDKRWFIAAIIIHDDINSCAYRIKKPLLKGLAILFYTHKFKPLCIAGGLLSLNI
jgi:uncharacterized protein (DUF486 family)